MVLNKKIEFVRTPLDIPILLFFLTGVISIFTAIDPWYSLDSLRGEMLEGFLLFYLVVNNDKLVKNHISLTPPGGTVTFSQFTCINCHNQHGNKSYRNLRSGGEVYDGVTFSNDIITYSMDPTGASTTYVVNTVSPGRGVAKYETSNVLFRKVPTAHTEGIQGFCKACHENFHGAGGTQDMGGSASGDTSVVGDEWKRHPTMDVTLSEGGTNLHADKDYWVSGPTWRPRVIDPDGTINGDEVPFCLTCHRAHGSSRHSALIFGDPSSGPGGGGTYMRDTCQRCHNQ